MNIGDKVVFKYDKISDKVGTVTAVTSDGVSVKWDGKTYSVNYTSGEVKVPRIGEIEQRKIATKNYEEFLARKG